MTPTMTPTKTPTKTPTSTPSGPGYSLFPAGVLLAQTGNDGSNLCNEWVYTLVVEQDYPSRMAVVKNVLGNTVDIITPWNPPLPWPAVSNPNWSAATGATVTGPQLVEMSPTDTGAAHWQHWYTWTISWLNPVTDPGPPFDLYYINAPSSPVKLQNSVLSDGTVDQTQQFKFRTDESNPAAATYNAALIFTDQTSTQPFVGSNANDAVRQQHLDVVGQNSTLVNWGLEIFSTGIDYVACNPPQIDCTNPTGHSAVQVGIVAPIDTTDKGDVSTIETAMGLISGGGQNVFGSTPTKKALEFGTTLLQATAVGTSALLGNPLTDEIYTSGNCDADCRQAHTFTLPVDPKLDCNRTYTMILVTDGLSNYGNPGGCQTAGTAGSPTWGNWIDPCYSTHSGCSCDNTAQYGTYSGGPGCPDGGDPTYLDSAGLSYVCPGDYQHFAAGSAENAWFATVTDPLTLLPKSLNVRTWVIGVSPDVGPCELNATAYHGRTDASSPNGDLGFVTDNDPFLPHSTDPLPPWDTSYDGPRAPGDCPWVHPSVPGRDHLKYGDGNYAFFAGSATALYDALKNLLGAYGAGNYTTSAPSIANTTTLTNVGFITTAEYPGWYGHMYAYDLTRPIICNSDSDCPTAANGVGRCDTIAGTTDYQKCKPPDTYHLLWDAGEVVSAFTSLGASKTVNNGLPRKIYTWDPSPSKLSTLDPTQILVPIEASNATLLSTICSCGITSQVVDFMRGNDGNGNARRWALGSIVNSTPGIIGPPLTWKQFAVHPAFETKYLNRATVAWAGSSDGAIHAFDINDGAELVALIPPDKLDLQVRLYNNFVNGITNPSDASPMGEPTLPQDHLYGTANSPRFADIADPAASDGTGYRTVLVVGEGPGGTGLHAFDVTHPTGPRCRQPGQPQNGSDGLLMDLPSAAQQAGFQGRIPYWGAGQATVASNV